MNMTKVVSVTAALGLVALTVDPAWAADVAFYKSSWWKTSWRIINFLILAGLIFKVARDPAKAFFASKREEAEKEIGELEQAKLQAERELADLKDKLANADQEIENLIEQLKEMASRNREKILEDAKRLAEETMVQAKVTAESEMLRAKQRLAEESAGVVIALASAKLTERLTVADQQRLLDQALSDMESAVIH